jgi:phosphate-selective porin OprO and OprP
MVQLVAFLNSRHKRSKPKTGVLLDSLFLTKETKMSLFKMFLFSILAFSLSFGNDTGNVFLPSLVKPKGFIQGVATYHLDDGSKVFVNNFSARRVQMSFDGTVYKDFNFKVFTDFSGANFLLLDSYLDWNLLPILSLRVGKFKVPTNFERLQASSRLQFIEPGFSSSLLPNRDVGVQLSGSFLKLFEYQLASFNGVQDGNSGSDDNNDDKDLWLRTVVNLGGLSLGSSFGRGWHDNSTLPSYKTPNRSNMFSYRPAITGSNTIPGVVSKGYVKHFNPQVVYYGGGLTLGGEYVKSSHTVEKTGFGSKNMTHYSWQSQFALVLTGEEQTYKGFKVKNPIHKNGIGAIEVLGRIGEIEFDESAFENDVWVDRKSSVESVFGWTIGTNWYLNDAVRFQLNYEDNEFSGSSNKPEEQILSASMNLSY